MEREDYLAERGIQVVSFDHAKVVGMAHTYALLEAAYQAGDKGLTFTNLMQASGPHASVVNKARLSLKRVGWLEHDPVTKLYRITAEGRKIFPHVKVIIDLPELAGTRNVA